MFPKSNTNLGKTGENLAIDFLKDRGYKIINKNYSSPLGEIDIIAKKNKQYFFFEVKTRKSLQFGQPQESVDTKKLFKIKNTINYYLKENDLFSKQINLKVISIILNGKNANINVIDA